MRNLFKKSLTLCLVAILAFSCFAGIVSAETAYTATIAVVDQTITQGTTSVDVTLNINSSQIGINEALIEVSSDIGTINSKATLDEATAAIASIELPEGSTNYGSFYLSAKNDISGETGETTVLGSIATASITVTFTVDENKAVGTYPINIKVDGVRAASGNEDVITFTYATANVTVAEPHVHKYTYTPNDNKTHNGVCACNEAPITNEACVDGDDEDTLCDKCGGETAEVVEVATATVNRYSSNDLVSSKDYDDLGAALKQAEIDGENYDVVVNLNKDTTLVSDAIVSYYTTLNLGDYTVTNGEYDFTIASNGKVTANYDVTNFDSNPLITEAVSNDVYTYTSAIAIRLNSKNLTLLDSIFVNFKAKYSNKTDYNVEYSMVYYQVTAPDKIYTVASGDFDTADASNFSAATIGIPAKEMGVNFVAKYCAKVTIDGVDYYAYSNTVEYSIVVYANNLLSKESTPVATKNLLKAMLNYGTAAQYYYDFDTDNLANAILDPADRVLPENYADYMIPAQTVASNLDDVVTLKPTSYVSGSSLELLDAINIKYTIKKANDDTVDYKMCFWTINEYNAFVEQAAGSDEALSALLVPDNCNNIVEVNTGDTYALLTGIAAKQFANTYISRLVEIDAEGNVRCDWVQSYSAIQYGVNMCAKDTTSDELKMVCKTMAVYSAMARVYFSNYEIDS